MDCAERTLENIPPKHWALLRPSRRALYQAVYIWMVLVVVVVVVVVVDLS